MDLLLKMMIDFHAGFGKHRTITDIFRKAFGEEYAEKALPFSYVTKTELGLMEKYLDLGKGQIFADIGCGHGGPGLWVALKNGANLIGMDLTDTAVENATERIKEFNLAGEARFQVGEFTSTGLPDSSCDGVMSADVLIFLPNPLEGFREVARILKTTSMFVFTNWESYLPGRLGDHRPLLEDAGFSILKYEHAKKAWMDRQRQVYVDTLKSEQALIDEMSIECATPWLMDAKTNLQLLDKMKRIFVAVQKN